VAVGQEPNDLLDQRDLLLDKLSKLGNVNVSYDASRNATVSLGGLTVVDASGAIPRTRAAFDAQFPASLPAGAGKLGALLDTYQNTIPSYQGRLDDLAVALHDDVNAVHTAGFDLSGAAGVSFFSGATITGASQLAVNPAILADGTKIAAAGSATAGRGDSSNAIRMVALRNATSAGLGTTFADHYGATISQLGVAAQAATNDKATSDAVVTTLQARRDSTSGVSLDEEMVNLVQYQHAFSAAGRVISTLDSMLDTLVNLGR
jgi:flagellar hook-associated protein 1 FlgK